MKSGTEIFLLQNQQHELRRQMKSRLQTDQGHKTDPVYLDLKRQINLLRKQLRQINQERKNVVQKRNVHKWTFVW